MRRLLLTLLLLALALVIAGCGSQRHVGTDRTITAHGDVHIYSATIVGINPFAPGYGWWSYPPPGSTPYSPSAGSANEVAISPPAGLSTAGKRQFRQGEVLVGESGCLGCHALGYDGNNGPGPPLTHIASIRDRAEIEHSLVDPTAPMPSFVDLRRNAPRRFAALVAFLADLH